MKAAWSARYTMDWAEHVFPVRKYRGIRDRLIADRTLRSEDLLEPPPATDDELHTVHPEAYLRRLEEMTRSPELGIFEFEVPVTRSVVATFRLMAGGTILASRRALDDGASANVGGGFHHAFADHGEGFCLLNDLAVAARVLQREGRVKKVAIIDLDVHQGNGTARIFAGDPSVYTFSMHQENNYPPKERSTWDLGLDDGCGDEEFLGYLRRALPKILDEFKPDLVIYQAGADPFREDKLGGLGLTIDGLAERDRVVASECRTRKIPIVGTLGGGYARREEDVVTIHSNTIRILKESAADE